MHEVLDVLGQRYLLGDLGNHRLSGQHHSRDAAGVFQGGTGYLQGVDDAALHQVTKFTEFCVETPVTLTIADIVQNHLAVVAGVFAYQDQRSA